MRRGGKFNRANLNLVTCTEVDRAGHLREHTCGGSRWTVLGAQLRHHVLHFSHGSVPSLQPDRIPSDLSPRLFTHCSTVRSLPCVSSVIHFESLPGQERFRKHSYCNSWCFFFFFKELSFIAFVSKLKYNVHTVKNTNRVQFDEVLHMYNP